MKMVMKCPKAHPGLREDAALTATGIFRPDQKKPGDWMLWVKDNGDVTVLVGARGNGDKIDADDTRSGLETIPRSVSQMGTGVEKYGVESAAMQTGQPSGGPGNEKTMQRPQKSSGRTPLSDELKTSRLFSVAGIILFYGLGSCVWINGLIGKRRERG